MTSEQITKTEKTLSQRGLPEDSYFEAVFEDGSSVAEHNVNWSEISERVIVDYFGHKETFGICKYPLASLKIFLDGLSAQIDVPKGCHAYQYIRSRRLLAQGVDRSEIIGRGVGLIKDGVVIEEKFINALEYKVEGLKR